EIAQELLHRSPVIEQFRRAVSQRLRLLQFLLGQLERRDGVLRRQSPVQNQVAQQPAAPGEQQRVLWIERLWPYLVQVNGEVGHTPVQIAAQEANLSADEVHRAKAGVLLRDQVEVLLSRRVFLPLHVQHAAVIGGLNELLGWRRRQHRIEVLEGAVV